MKTSISICVAAMMALTACQSSNQFAGDPIFQNATVRFVSISEDKQEVYGLFLVKAKGPGYKNAQDCGFTFKIHGTKKTPPVRPQKTTDASAEYQAKHPLIGTEFTIYTNSACTEVATSSDGSPAVVTITNQGNIGEINLSSGTYWIKETKATNGYELNTQAKQFSVTGSESEPINLEMFNSAAYANLRIQKTGVGNYSVSGAVFEVYEDSNCTTRTKDSNGNFVSISVRNSNGCMLLTDKQYKINEYSLGYLRKPTEITLDNPYDEYEDFEDIIMPEIIKIAAQMYLENK